MKNENDNEKKLEEFVNKVEGENSETGLGKAQMFYEKQSEINNEFTNVGYKPIPVENLPSKGLFYPDNFKILIRPASVAEIRHWSSLDENDVISVNDAVIGILSKCVMVNGGTLSHKYKFKDICEVDKFYILFAIRELTFINGENKLFIDVDGDKVEIKKENLRLFVMPESLKRFYSPDDKCFKFKFKGSNEDIKLYLPTIGVAEQLKDYVIEKKRNKEDIDTSFISFLPFLIQDYRNLTKNNIENIRKEMLSWNLKKMSLLSYVLDEIKKSTEEPTVVVEKNGAEKVVPLTFQNGVKSIFINTNILDELE